MPGIGREDEAVIGIHRRSLSWWGLAGKTQSWLGLIIMTWSIREDSL